MLYGSFTAVILECYGRVLQHMCVRLCQSWLVIMHVHRACLHALCSAVTEMLIADVESLPAALAVNFPQSQRQIHFCM